MPRGLECYAKAIDSYNATKKKLAALQQEIETSDDAEALGRRHRLELSMVALELNLENKI